MFLQIIQSLADEEDNVHSPSKSVWIGLRQSFESSGCVMWATRTCFDEPVEDITKENKTAF